MKRMMLIALLLLALLIPSALADAQPRVSFTAEQLTAQSGDTVQLTLTADVAPSQDITVTIADSRDNRYPVTLRQGETQAVLEVTTERSSYKKRFEYRLQKN